jgi:hypothetical protein
VTSASHLTPQLRARLIAGVITCRVLLLSRQPLLILFFVGAQMFWGNDRLTIIKHVLKKRSSR